MALEKHEAHRPPARTLSPLSGLTEAEQRNTNSRELGQSGTLCVPVCSGRASIQFLQISPNHRSTAVDSSCLMCAAVRRLLILPRRWLWVSLGERDVGPAATAYAASARSDPYWAARAVSSLLPVARLRRGSVKMSHGINRNSKQTCSSSAPSFWLLSA